MKRNSVIVFESFGVTIKVESTDSSVIRRFSKQLGAILPIDCRIVETSLAVHSEHHFFVENGENIQDTVTTDTRPVYNLLRNTQLETENVDFAELSRVIESKIRLTVAEYAADFVFLHAGAVKFQNRAIIIPGRSFSGKTSLIVELLKNGCDYLSDEYAVIDRQGFVRCFPKALSVRGIIDDYTQKEIDAAEFGARVFEQPLRPGWILKSKYSKRRRRFSLTEISAGEGLLACLDNSISIRRQPKFVLEILGRLADDCTAFRTERGEASVFAPKFLDFLAENYNKS